MIFKPLYFLTQIFNFCLSKNLLNKKSVFFFFSFFFFFHFLEKKSAFLVIPDIKKWILWRIPIPNITVTVWKLQRSRFPIFLDWHSFKGELHPSTKISMFCLFSPSSRGKLILFMYGRDRCVWFKVKKHDIVSMDLRISHVERFKIFFSLFNLKNHFKINVINSCFYYS